MEYKTIWIEVDVKDELPEKEGDYIVKEPAGFLQEARYVNGWFIYDERKREMVSYDKYVTHWLKRVDIPIYTEQEIEAIAYQKVIGVDAIDGYSEGHLSYQEELLKQLK